MFLYNVTFKVDLDIADVWVKWIKEIYIPMMLDTGKFDEPKLCRLMGVEESDGFTYALQFLCPNITTYQLFQEKDAYAIQKKHALRFKDRFVSFSTLMKVIE